MPTFNVNLALITSCRQQQQQQQQQKQAGILFQQTNFQFLLMFENRLEIWPIFDWETAEERRDFVLRVYLLLAAFMAFALLQWLAVLGFFTAKGKELLSAHESAVVLVFAVTMLLFLIFLVSSQVRGMSYLSCFLSMLIVSADWILLLYHNS
ncbi:uncharacterized protein LOC115632127 [Scaptodrosophila lebanonensis]|uniref:Uncharacterized protein LOC115632127 n=1 Tax=Drosophila lebanonensis TaxID=7225 RepID=A0A6J2UC34_DROLE|nr:uncharacterized protein LOC115632127 [Scaptodrosophila lebanonensis]